MQISPLRVYESRAPRQGNKSAEAINFFVLPWTRAFLFLVKKIFSRGQKIKFIFFLSILKRVSSLKPAGEDSAKPM